MKKDYYEKMCISKLFLQSGNSLHITDGVIVKHPTIKDILEIGNETRCEDVYWGYVSILYSDPYLQMVWLDDMKIDYQEVSPFDVFVLRWLIAIKENNTEIISHMNQSLNFFLEGKHKFNLLPLESDSSDKSNKVTWILLDELNNECVINEDIFNIINFFILQINNIDESGRINPGSEGAKKMLISQKRSEERRKKRNNNEKPSDSLGEAISTAIWGSNGGVNVDNYKAQPIYMITSGLKITIQRLNYELVMSGVYAGTVKSDSISPELTYWMR